jgi:hypothetical protein
LSDQEAPEELDAYYSFLQQGWQVEERGDLAGMVVPNGNGSAPVHRWFRMKEAFSCDLLEAIAGETQLTARRSITVCDPFSGSGTTAVSLGSMVANETFDSATFLGLESNPFLQLVSASKLRALQRPPKGFTRVAQRVGAMTVRGGVDPAPTPRLTTFENRSYFDPMVLRELLTLRAAIDAEEEAGSDPLAVDLARVCLGAVVESCSSLRRDGRALRHEATKVAARPAAAFLAKCEEVEEDLPRKGLALTGTVSMTDARDGIPNPTESGRVDLFLFSPPYPNNIDYTEVYKLEGWLLGMYASRDDFSGQRHKTIRSHASLDFGEAPHAMAPADRSKVDQLIAPLLESMPVSGRYAASRRRTIRGYAYDMFQSLSNLESVASDDAQLVYVVGNSLHGGHEGHRVLIAADLLIARLAELAGFTIEKIAVARYPTRRRTESRFLRESVVFARRAQGATA